MNENLESNEVRLVVQEDNNGERIDAALSEMMEDFSRSRCANLIKENQVKLNGCFVKSKKTVKVGDVISVVLPELRPVAILPENIKIEIVYEDSSLAVINKPQGLVVHPANGDYSNTLVNALLYHIKDLSGINGDIRPGIVHRLDKDTSGLLVIAKNDVAHKSLSEQISTKVCQRVYWALVEGVVKQDGGEIEQPLGRSLVDRKKMDIVFGGKYAKTTYSVLKRFSSTTLVKFVLSTGRTHQIRVHSKFLGHPVVGDKVYGFKNQKFSLQGQLLHSKTLSFFHPVSKQWMSFDSNLPEHFEKILSVIKE